MTSRFFSDNYQQARDRFRQAASRLDAERSAHAIDVSKHLTIDIATIGSSDAAKAIIVSSGVHGVEGFFGSAIQSAWLSDRKTADFDNIRMVFIHAINPYGFDNLRRFNEDNVDLNRNFHRTQDNYSGAPPGYHQLNGLLNPATPAGRADFFTFRALYTLLKSGMPAIREAVASGQYEYPKGLFFGGKTATASTRIVQDNIESWLGNAQEIVHVDFHSGLGKFSDYRLSLLHTAANPACDWYRNTFDSDRVEPLADAGAVGYVAVGAMGAWLLHRFKDRDYRFVTAEFGTYSPLRVLASLRKENRVHFYNRSTDATYQRAKRELLECFCPKAETWRENVVAAGLKIIAQATK